VVKKKNDMRLYQSIVFVLAVLGVCVGAASVRLGGMGQQHLNPAPIKITQHQKAQALRSVFSAGRLTPFWCWVIGAGHQTPYTYLLDTGTPSPIALSERELAQKTGWTIVAEDNLRHKFKGDTVFLNDKITVVLRRSGSGAEVYSKTADGLKQRAQLFACADGAERTAGLSSVRIIENNPAAVMLEAVFQTQQGKDVSVTYRLTTGQIYLEISPGKGMNSLLIRTKARYVVVPDFFGDDVVFSPEDFEGPRIDLPAENFLLHLLESNDAIVMCVWESDTQSYGLLTENMQAISLERGRRRAINGCDIQCIEDKRIWVAFMEGSDIWHERLISDEDKGRDIVLDWEPPFPAKWRADFIKKDELAESWNFKDDPSILDTRFSIPNRESSIEYPVSRIIVYPIDRSRATPLRIFCPVDIVRNTLGVGPCQYILEKEGFGSALGATPEQITRWVENLFKKNKEKHASAQIEERFKQMVEHMRQTQMRIKQYGDFARQLRELGETEKVNKALADASGKLLGIVDDLEQNIVIRSNSAKPSESSARLAEKIIALTRRDASQRVGKDGALRKESIGLADCQKLGSQIRAIGAAQDKALSKCRMAVRRIKQQCMTIARKEPQAADFAGKVQDLAESALGGLHRK